MLFALRALLAFGESCDRGKQREDASENRCRRDGNPVDLAEDGRRADCCDSGLSNGLDGADARAFQPMFNVNVFHVYDLSLYVRNYEDIAGINRGFGHTIGADDFGVFPSASVVFF